MDSKMLDCEQKRVITLAVFLQSRNKATVHGMQTLGFSKAQEVSGEKICRKNARLIFLGFVWGNYG